MALEVNVGDRTAQVEIINRNGNNTVISVDGKKYKVDIVMVENGVYSLIHNGISYNVELIENDGPKNIRLILYINPRY